MINTHHLIHHHLYHDNKNSRLKAQKTGLPALIILLLVLFISGCNSDNTGDTRNIEPPATLLTKLNAIEGVQANLVSSPVNGYRLYELLVEQPTDHNNQQLPAFLQRVRILMKNEQSPVVLQTLGYGLGSIKSTKLAEVTQRINGTQVAIEHRFFQASVPENIDWSLMTIEQAAADHHRIITLLKPLFSSNWIATGKSKGGMAATYLSRFYPDDIRGVIAYVAPLSLSMWDERFSDYTQQVVSIECQNKFKTFQYQSLLRIDELVVMVDAWALEKNATVNSNGYDLNQRLQTDIALSWISIGSYYPELLCEYLPEPSDETQVFYDFIYQLSGFEFIADEGLVGWLPYHVQAALELGNFAVPISHLEDLLTVDVKDFAINMLGDPLPEFQPEIMQNIYEWAQFEASHLIFIYGEQDIFTGGAYPVTTDESRDNQLYIEPGLHSIKIADLLDSSQQQIDVALLRWSQ
jgi:hypothetical protein